MAVDAVRLFERVTRADAGATSCLIYYEVEEALYRLLAQSAKGVSNASTLLIPAARSITTQVQSRPYCLDGRCAVASGWNP
jgi:hypothetical protein